MMPNTKSNLETFQTTSQRALAKTSGERDKSKRSIMIILVCCYIKGALCGNFSLKYSKMNKICEQNVKKQQFNDLLKSYLLKLAC